ncbi:DDE-type integrase/transposase/recombinase [Shewanella sp. 202IG2-18]|nr:DDE-type integrase/transposase/recombinase [Parashewanella hymeniacidonis]
MHNLLIKVTVCGNSELLLALATKSNTLCNSYCVDFLSGSNAAALETLNWQLLLLQMAGCLIEVLQVKYLNNIVEQSHRAVKWQMRTALGYKSIEGAKASIAGVELWQMIKELGRKQPSFI